VTRRIHFDLLETTLLLSLAAGATFVFQEHRTTRRISTLRQPFDSLTDERLDAELRARYGPQRYSTGPEEWIIRDVFQDRRDGVFVDVGAWHWEKGSNTYFLERRLGWTGLAIDAWPEFSEGWRRHRPRSLFVGAFVDAVDGGLRTLYVGANSQTSSATRDVPAEFGGGVVEERHVTTRRLDTLLKEARITRIDLLSMDIENNEPAALAGFTVTRYRPTLVCIEAHMPARPRILEYFANAGYVIIGKYLRYDVRNLYFEPLRPTQASAR
jgi:FkbM family methyltransferase